VGVGARRLVFGQAADLYHRYRPSYPEPLVDDLIALAGLDGSRSVLEVGAGTGKATALFAGRGIPVLAVEPSADMSAVLREIVCATGRGVRVETCDFEDWGPAGRRFPLVYSAQAWHWVRPEVGYAKAAAVLDPGGWLAVFWNRVDWASCELRDELLVAYEAAAPEMERDGGLHPSCSLGGPEEDWATELARAAGLGAAEVRTYQWSLDYTVQDYLGFLGTASRVHLMEPAQRQALFAAVADVIEAAGGKLTLPLSTLLCMARRVG
jgi:SAM-dependent methyltransferase